MYERFFNHPLERDGIEFSTELPDEFDPLRIRVLAARLRADEFELKRRMMLSNLGGWLVSLGHSVQHAAHLPFHLSHASWKTVSTQSIKIRHPRR